MFLRSPVLSLFSSLLFSSLLFSTKPVPISPPFTSPVPASPPSLPRLVSSLPQASLGYQLDSLTNLTVTGLEVLAPSPDQPALLLQLTWRAQLQDSQGETGRLEEEVRMRLQLLEGVEETSLIDCKSLQGG